MNKNFEILETIPISGEINERHFGQTDSNPLWIKFSSINSDNWIGSFSSGTIGLKNRKISEIEKTSKIGLLTNGAFYLFDKESGDLIFYPEQGHFIDFEIIPELDLIILATNWGINIIKGKKRLKEIRPDFIDGVRFMEKYENSLIGEIFEPSESGDNWSKFELDLKTLELNWGKYKY
ncbi:MAG: hypothetical protein K8S16_08290 [Bacteroidales bacterium]|nr:hypothetical protein [Bacteroidales bacterium]